MTTPNATTSPRAAGPPESLARRRRKALWTILGAAGATGGAAVVPAPGLEIPKQAAVGFGDMVLLATIHTIYFDEESDEETVMEMLREAGVVLAVGGGFAYATVKLTEGVLAEVLNFVPIVGWLASGLLTASVTTSVGVLWCLACDAALRHGTSPGTEIRLAMA